MIEGENIGVCIRNRCNDTLTFTPQIIVPEIIKAELLTGKDKLIPRKSTNYCYIVLERIADDGEIAQDDGVIPF